MALSVRMCSSVIRSVLGLRPVAFNGTSVGGVWRRMASSTETSQKSENADAAKGAGESAAVNETKADATNFEEEKKKLADQLTDIQDKYKRALAETENVRRRLEKQIKDAKLFGIQGFCKDLLEVSDILSKATDSLSQEELKAADPALKSLYEGLQMTETQLHKVFTRHGLVQLNPAEGEKFDPNFHEALFRQPLAPGKTAGSVSTVSKVGYKLHDRTLRPALVGVYGSN